MAAEKYVLAAGNTMTWTFGDEAHRGVYLGRNQAFSLTSGRLENTTGAGNMQHRDDVTDQVMPVVVLNPIVPMRTILGGVFWGSLLSGTVVGVIVVVLTAVLK